jgi:4a-hydroxytetrahydrobiopterin dehydratase
VTRPDLLDPVRVDEWLGEHREWQLRDARLVRVIRTTDYPSSVEIVAAQVEVAERLDHHPMVSLGYCEVTFELWTHDRGGITQLDLDYASALDDIVATRFAVFLATT